MLLRGTAIVSVVTLLSRVLGFIRDLLVARLLGASLFADAFFVAFRIPNLLRSFLAEGALTSAFTPTFCGALAESPERARATFRRIVGFLLTITLPLTALGIAFAPALLSVIAPGFEAGSERFVQCVSLTRMMLPYIACVSIIALINAALNALNIFGASAWAQVVMNMVLIAGALAATPLQPAHATYVLAISVLLGGIAQILAQAPALRRSKLSLRPTWQLKHRDVGDVVRLMLPATVGASVYQITIFIATLLASLLPEGSVAWLFYADRVAQFPLGIFSIALASVLLPALASASAQRDSTRFRSGLADAIRFNSFLIIPMATGLFSLATPITQLLFERGAFSPHSTEMTSAAVRAMALGLWATSCHSLIVRAFIARKDTLTPTLIGLCALLINVLSSLALMGPIAAHSDLLSRSAATVQGALYAVLPWQPALGHIGLALASSIAACGSLVLVVTIFHRKIGDFPWRESLGATTRAALSAGCMAAALSALTTQGLSALATVALGVGGGAVVYTLSAALLRSHELSETLTVAARILRRRTRSSAPRM